MLSLLIDLTLCFKQVDDTKIRGVFHVVFLLLISDAVKVIFSHPCRVMRSLSTSHKQGVLWTFVDIGDATDYKSDRPSYGEIV